MLKQMTFADGEKKRNILLTVCGSKIYGLMRNLLSPETPDSKSFQELAKLVEEHLNPKPSMVVPCFKFYNKVRQPSQSVFSWQNKLHSVVMWSTKMVFDHGMDGTRTKLSTKAKQCYSWHRS